MAPDGLGPWASTRAECRGTDGVAAAANMARGEAISTVDTGACADIPASAPRWSRGSMRRDGPQGGPFGDGPARVG